MGLRTYILRRIIYSVFLIFAVITVNFILFNMLPGSPASVYVNPIRPQPGQTEIVESIWGLSQPLHIRFAKYVINLLTWNFGTSFAQQVPIAQTMSYRLSNTLVLMGGSTLLSLVIGIFLGVLTVHKRGGTFDTAAVTISLITFSLPTFWMGLLFRYVFALKLNLFPLGHAYPPLWTRAGQWPAPTATFNLLGTDIVIPSLYELTTRMWHAFLPLLTLTLFQYGGWLLLTRATMLEAITEDYVVTARAKGVPERTVLFKHALKNASLPLITNAALSFGFILTGAIITETVFQWPGLGLWIWESIMMKDLPVIQAMFYIVGLCVIIANFVADILYGIVDPRIKYG